MSFQQSVNLRYAQAQAGDFASANPRFSVLAGPNSLVAGAAGVLIAAFAWAVAYGSVDPETGENDAYNTVNSFGAGAPTGFVHREQQGVITTFLADAGNLIPQGQMVTLMGGGDFWIKNTGAGAAAVGQKVFASNTTGLAQAAAAGATVAGYTETKWFVASVAEAGALFKMTDHF
jgi:predicted RecA/RadA family phage recombinase